MHLGQTARIHVTSGGMSMVIPSLLFNLALEPLSCYILQDNRLHGVTIGSQVRKIALFA